MDSHFSFGDFPGLHWKFQSGINREKGKDFKISSDSFRNQFWIKPAVGLINEVYRLDVENIFWNIDYGCYRNCHAGYIFYVFYWRFWI